MKYLKCLGDGAIGMALAASAMIMVSCIVMLGMIGLEWFLGLFGGKIVLPPDVSRGSILGPIILTLWALIVLPCFGWLIRRCEKLQEEVELLANEKAILANQIALAQREKEAMA